MQARVDGERAVLGAGPHSRRPGQWAGDPPVMSQRHRAMRVAHGEMGQGCGWSHVTAAEGLLLSPTGPQSRCQSPWGD